jgi:PleD family two-component response regulator
VIPGRSTTFDAILALLVTIDRLHKPVMPTVAVFTKLKRAPQGQVESDMRSGQDTGGLVLIVEDNRNISEMVGEYLESRGFEVDYAQAGL